MFVPSVGTWAGAAFNITLPCLEAAREAAASLGRGALAGSSLVPSPGVGRELEQRSNRRELRISAGPKAEPPGREPSLPRGLPKTGELAADGFVREFRRGQLENDAGDPRTHVM